MTLASSFAAACGDVNSAPTASTRSAVPAVQTSAPSPPTPEPPSATPVTVDTSPHYDFLDGTLHIQCRRGAVANLNGCAAFATARNTGKGRLAARLLQPRSPTKTDKPSLDAAPRSSPKQSLLWRRTCSPRRETRGSKVT